VIFKKYFVKMKKIFNFVKNKYKSLKEYFSFISEELQKIREAGYGPRS
jgi:hypothetical protein